MKTSLRILTAALMLAGFQSMAEQGAAPEGKNCPDPGARFAKRDTNGDGKLSVEEFKAGMPEDKAAKADEIFAKIDGDKDGALTKEEMKAAHEKRMGREGQGPRGEGPKGDCPKADCPKPECPKAGKGV